MAHSTTQEASLPEDSSVPSEKQETDRRIEVSVNDLSGVREHAVKSEVLDQRSSFKEREVEEEEEEEEGDEVDEDGTDGWDMHDHRRLVDESRSQPCRVVDVIVTGNERTKKSVILRELSNVLSAKVFDKVLVAAAEAQGRLRSLGIFEDVAVRLDSGPDDTPGTATLEVDVVERRTLLSANVGTYVQGKEQTVELTGSLKNAAGYAESADIHFSWGQESGNGFSGSVSVPRAIFPLAAFSPGMPAVGPLSSARSFLADARLELRAAQTTRSLLEYSSHSQTSRGASASLQSGPHQLEYELTWRDNCGAVGGASSPAIRRELGHSVLSALRYTQTLDHRDSRTRPSRGYALRYTAELAGLGLDPHLVRFLRQELEFGFARRLHKPSRTTLTAGIRCGCLIPWSSTTVPGSGPGPWYAVGGRPPLINDRFFLGGPGSLRGFRAHGVGPFSPRSRPVTPTGVPTPNQQPVGAAQDAPRDALGGDFLLAANVGVSFDLPLQRLREVGLHGQLFSSLGTLLPWASIHSIAADGRSDLVGKARDLASQVAATMRWSAGAGLVWPTVFGRLEVNYCLVLRKQPGDFAPKRGFEFGFNSSIL